MAGVVQWTIDQFWNNLQSLKSQIDQVESALLADKARLTALYSTARQNMDPARDVYLTPLIHRNSVLRLSYLQPIKDKFTQAVNAASAALRAAGYTTPNLSGMGFVFAIAPAAAVTLVLVALAAIAIAWRLTQAQITRTDAMAALFSDPGTTPDQKLALSRQQQQQMSAEDKANPPLGLDLGKLLPIAGIVALIVLGPRILDMIQSRRRASA